MSQTKTKPKRVRIKHVSNAEARRKYSYDDVKVKEVIEFLSHLPPDALVWQVKYDDPKFVFHVNERGVAYRVMTKNTQNFSFSVTYPIHG